MFTKFLIPFLSMVIMAGISSSVHAQTPFDQAVRFADISPAWPDCDPIRPECTTSRLNDFIQANLQLPEEAKANQMGGVVIMEFVIEKNGTIGLVRPMKDPGYGMGAEATRVLSLMNDKKIKWIPAYKDGKRVAFRYFHSVSFGLPKTEIKKSEVVKTEELPADYIYDVADVMPRFAGCDSADGEATDCTFRKLLDHVSTNLTYPEAAIEGQLQGMVVVQFVVDAMGAVTQATVLDSPSEVLNEEALRLVNTMPKWSPGLQAGKPVPVRLRLPIQFRLPKE